MIGRKLSSRLERLEGHLTPEPKEEIILQFRWVRRDGTSGDGPRFVVSFNPLGPKWIDACRWKGHRNTFRWLLTPRTRPAGRKSEAPSGLWT